MPKTPVIALAFVLLLPAVAHAQNWEYKVQEVDLISKVRVFANDLLLSADELETLLAPLGEEGWELVTTVERGGTSLLLVLKRPVPTVAPQIVTSAPPPVSPPPPVETPTAPAAVEEAPVVPVEEPAAVEAGP